MPGRRSPGRVAGAGRIQLAELVVHLARRQLESQHRFTVLGWLWPVLRQLAQLAVLVFLFSSVLDLGIDDYPLFVFAGLLSWSWFQAAVTAGTTALLDHRHLLMNPGCPAIALPLVAVAVPLVDTLLALPVLLVMLIVEGPIEATLLLLPLVLALQFLLTAGIVLLTSVANVYVRDVQSVVGVALLALFYLTPVFYGLKQVPDRFHILLDLNPVARLVTMVREVVLEGRLPSAGSVLYVLGIGVVLAAAGAWTFRRVAPDIPDQL
jgi:lipopolysaccharide transport system permease protein